MALGRLGSANMRGVDLMKGNLYQELFDNFHIDVSIQFYLDSTVCIYMRQIILPKSKFNLVVGHVGNICSDITNFQDAGVDRL